jgi:lysophospholipase L1-like esterase
MPPSAIFLRLAATLALATGIVVTASAATTEAPVAATATKAAAEVPSSPAAVKATAPASDESRTAPAMRGDDALAAAKSNPPCRAPANVAKLDAPLARFARRLADHEPIKIVAIGSSSTAGAGASTPDASYPSRLAIELKQQFPDRDITVLNRGVNGDETTDMLARFETGVIAERPDLVLWQVGSNSVLRDRPLGPAETQIHEGVEQLKAIGADVVLIDPQFAPKVITKHDAEGMVALIATEAKRTNVGLFRRFAVMRHWREVEGLPFETFVSADELHMNDWSYACVAKVLAGSIVEAATRSTTMAGGRATAPSSRPAPAPAP